MGGSRPRGHPPRPCPRADPTAWMLTAAPAACRLVLLPCARGWGWEGLLETGQCGPRGLEAGTHVLTPATWMPTAAPYSQPGWFSSPAREDQGGEGPLETGQSGPLRAPPDCAHMLTPPAGRSLLPLQPAGWFSSPAPEEGGGEGP